MTPAELRAATRLAIETWKAVTNRLADPDGGETRLAWAAVEAAIDAEIAAACPQWQPIETAPNKRETFFGIGFVFLVSFALFGWAYLHSTRYAPPRTSPLQAVHFSQWWACRATAPEEPR